MAAMQHTIQKQAAQLAQRLGAQAPGSALPSTAAVQARTAAAAAQAAAAAAAQPPAGSSCVFSSFFLCKRYAK